MREVWTSFLAQAESRALSGILSLWSDGVHLSEEGGGGPRPVPSDPQDGCAANRRCTGNGAVVRGALRRSPRRGGWGSRRATSRYLRSVRIRRADTLADVRTQTRGGLPRHAEIDQLTQHVAALEFFVALVDFIQLDVPGDQVVELKMAFFPSVQQLRHVDAESVATH
jgi:hypothetical protein